MRFCILLMAVAACSSSSVLSAAEGVWLKAVTGQYERYRLNLNETAQFMPEADYDFRLSPAQRPFAGWIEHTAEMNYNSCASLQGKPAPELVKGIADLKGKAALVKALAESFAFCDAAIATLDEAKATEELKIGSRKVVPATVLVNLIASLNEHYGNLVGYMRTKGIVPPTTARVQKKN